MVLTNMPDEASAQAMAEQLVEAKLAACVNVLAPCRSVYRWQGEVVSEAEVPLLIKTPRAHLEALQSAIRHAHPYELPEIIAVRVDSGLPAYLDWVAAECGPGR